MAETSTRGKEAAGNQISEQTNGKVSDATQLEKYIESLREHRPPFYPEIYSELVNGHLWYRWHGRHSVPHTGGLGHR